MFCDGSRFLRRRFRDFGKSWHGEKIAALACALCIAADTVIESCINPVWDAWALWVGLLFVILSLLCVAFPFGGNIALAISWCVVFPLPVDLSMSVSVVIAEPLIVLSYQRIWCGVVLA